MSCPYCLAFHRDGAISQSSPQQSTLVQAYWEFEDEGKSWNGFSPSVSGLLETSFQNWMADPALRENPQIQQGNFKYTVDYSGMRQQRHPSRHQRIRRVGVVSEPASKAASDARSDFTKPVTAATSNGAGKKFSQVRDSDGRRVIVDPTLCREIRAEADCLRAEIQRLRDELTGERKQIVEVEAKYFEEKKTLVGRVRSLEGELASERSRVCGLLRHLGGILPGQIVSVIRGRNVAPISESESEDAQARLTIESDGCNNLLENVSMDPGAVGRVILVEDGRALVRFSGGKGACFPISQLHTESNLELAARQGSRVNWLSVDGSRAKGVVCDLKGDLDAEVLCSDNGARVTLHIGSLNRDISSLGVSRAFDGDAFTDDLASPGDYVEAEGIVEGTDAVGVLVWRDAESCCARFSYDGGSVTWAHSCGQEVERSMEFHPPRGPSATAAGHIDILIRSSHCGVPVCSFFKRALKAETIRPGGSVRLTQVTNPEENDSFQHGDGRTGLVYAVHGDGTAIVDFLGRPGYRCNVGVLRAVDDLGAAEETVLRMMGEFAAWHEVCVSRGVGGPLEPTPPQDLKPGRFRDVDFSCDPAG